MQDYHDRVFTLALAVVPHIGPMVGKQLLAAYGSAKAVFEAKIWQLQQLDGVGEFRAQCIKNYKDFVACEKELAFAEKYGISVIGQQDPEYPRRLLNCPGAPMVLFAKGSANLNASRIVSIVGTRSCTDYGISFTEKFIQDLAAENVTVISGMALGIDTIAHRAALKNKLPTVGVLAHGLHTIYPVQNRQMAKQMLEDGGALLTEFFSGVTPDKHHFPRRNSIVAGMADATIVIETDEKGGSMITAGLAHAFNRDLFALPGRVTDPKSRGCNLLLQQKTAAALRSAQDFLAYMKWSKSPAKKNVQIPLFVELEGNEKLVYNALAQNPVHIDVLQATLALKSSELAASLLQLELMGAIQSLPGKMYKQMLSY